MKIISTFILIVVLSFAAYGQEYMTTLTYNISAPAGETASFIESPSYLGLSFDGRKFLLSAISVGFYTGWQVFYENINTPIEINQGTISGNQYRYMNVFPIMLNMHLYIGPDQCFRPYVGINAGAYFTWKRLNIGVLTEEEKKWVLGVAPEVGMTVPIGDVHLNLGMKYNYAMAPGESKYYAEPDPTQYVSFHIGFAYYR
jgi:hypothetical protein